MSLVDEMQTLVIDDELKEDLSRLAQCVRQNTVQRGVITHERAEYVDWMAVVVKAVSRDDG